MRRRRPNREAPLPAFTPQEELKIFRDADRALRLAGALVLAALDGAGVAQVLVPEELVDEVEACVLQIAFDVEERTPCTVTVSQEPAGNRRVVLGMRIEGLDTG